MPVDISKCLRIAISSRALFELEEEDRIYDRMGLEAYRTYQLENENRMLEPGTAFPLVRGLLGLNTSEKRRVEIIVVSKNHPETCIRVFKSIQHEGLDIIRAAFTGGESLVPYLEAFEIDLFLSRNKADVEEAIDAGFAAAVLYNQPPPPGEAREQLRIAFDADAVLFSEDSEVVYRNEGLVAFLDHEAAHADEPLAEGPFGRLIVKLIAMQREFEPSSAPLRIAIVTARNSPAHERVIKTLRAWDVGVDAAFFLGGLEKDKILKAFGAHIFFDDQDTHAALAAMSVPSALVPYKTGSRLRPVDTVEPLPSEASPPDRSNDEDDPEANVGEGEAPRDG
jgi:5'-nucleotidase